MRIQETLKRGSKQRIFLLVNLALPMATKRVKRMFSEKTSFGLFKKSEFGVVHRREEADKNVYENPLHCV